MRFLSLRTSACVRLLICLLSFTLCAHWSLWSKEWSSLCVWCKCCLCVLWLCACERTSTGVIIQNIRVQQKVGFPSSPFPCNTMQVDNRSRLSRRHYPLRFTVSFSYMSTAHIHPVTPLKRWPLVYLHDRQYRVAYEELCFQMLLYVWFFFYIWE